MRRWPGRRPTTIHSRIEGEVEVIESAVGIAKAALLPATLQQPVGATRDQVDGSHRFGLCLTQAGFEHRGHAAQAQLAQRAVEFDEVHDGFSCFEFWVRLSMRSR